MNTTETKFLVIGSSGQIGVELVAALEKRYGTHRVIAADLKHREGIDPTRYIELDVLDKDTLRIWIDWGNFKQVYLLAAMLSATGERYPDKAWDLNMRGLLNVLEIALEKKLQVFFPSSIAVYGPVLGQPTTIYGISKYAGENWCAWYHARHGLDVRCLRYPGLISHTTMPGGGTTDYAVDIFQMALETCKYTCFLKADTRLPMMYMEDAVRATIELMEAPAASLSTRMGYDVAAVSFTPAELAVVIRKHIPGFEISYEPDYRQKIADSWPGVIDDSLARRDWGWKHQYSLGAITADMIKNLSVAEHA